MQTKTILFITTTSPAVNPRMRKEVELALNCGFRCIVVYFYLGMWADKESSLWISSLPVKSVVLDATRKSYAKWFRSSILQMGLRYLNCLIPLSLALTSYASDKRSSLLVSWLNKMHLPVDVIIGHNLGSLYPIYGYAKRNLIPFIFDVEDYHPGEFIRFDKEREKVRRIYLMKKILPKAEALTSASPLIGEYTLKLIEGHPNHRTILNSFFRQNFVPPTVSLYIDSKPFKLVWFSQNIDFGRGLELLLNSLSRINIDAECHIELTLIGLMNKEFEENILKPFQQTIIKKNKIILNSFKPLSQNELHKELANHDIGLALELNKTDFNRQLCLTNKIFTYAQAGLYILATDTVAQKQFIYSHPDFGTITIQSNHDMGNAISEILQKRKDIKNRAKERYEKAKAFSWEYESQKLVDVWTNL